MINQNNPKIYLFLWCVCVYNNECMEKSLEVEQQVANNNIVLAVRFRVGRAFMFLISIHLGYSILFQWQCNTIIKQIFKLKINVIDFCSQRQLFWNQNGTQGLERVSIRNRAYSAVNLEDPEGSLLKWKHQDWTLGQKDIGAVY